MDERALRPVKIAAILFLVIGSLFLAVNTVNGVKGWSGRSDTTESIPRIMVTGTGEAFAAPTAATFTFTVMGDGASVKAAQDEATTLVNKALDMLKQSGIEQKNIKTIAYNVNPKYEYRDIACVRYPCPPANSVIVGYEVTQSVEVKTTDTTKAGELLSNIGELGVQNVSGLNFTVEDDTAIKRAARQKAIAEAKEKAQILANDLGVNLVRIVDFQESGDYPVFYERAALDAKGGAQSVPPEIPAGENKVTSNVTITYEIR